MLWKRITERIQLRVSDDSGINTAADSISITNHLIIHALRIQLRVSDDSGINTAADSISITNHLIIHALCTCTCMYYAHVHAANKR